METEATLREKPQSISIKLQKEKSARTEKKEHRKIMKKKNNEKRKKGKGNSTSIFYQF